MFSERDRSGQECFGGRSRRSMGQFTSTCVASGWCRDRFQSGGVVAAGPGSAARHKPIPQHSGILLHGSDMAASVATVERIRRAFQAEAEFIDGLPVRATLCAGVAGANTKVSLESLLKDADIAL